MQRKNSQFLTIAAEILALRVAGREITAKTVADLGCCPRQITVSALTHRNSYPVEVKTLKGCLSRHCGYFMGMSRRSSELARSENREISTRSKIFRHSREAQGCPVTATSHRLAALKHRPVARVANHPARAAGKRRFMACRLRRGRSPVGESTARSRRAYLHLA